MAARARPRLEMTSHRDGVRGACDLCVALCDQCLAVDTRCQPVGDPVFDGAFLFLAEWLNECQPD